MDWKKVNDSLPGENEEVLVRFRNIVSVARFEPATKRLVLKDGTFYDCRGKGVEWKKAAIPHLENASLFSGR
jgi:hypothetical protein